MYSAIPEYILESACTLPPVPAATEHLLSLARARHVDVYEITRIMELDPVLTARVLRAANSERFGASRHIQTVRQAALILGKDALIRLAVGTCAVGREVNAGIRWPIDPLDFWRHAILVASLSRLLAEQEDVDPDEAFVGGLLHDIGKLIMLEHYGDLYAQVLLAAQYGTSPLHLLERELFATDHAVVGHALSLHWNFPHPLTLAVSQHHDTVGPALNSSADVVRNANDLVKMYRAGLSGNRFVEFLRHNRIPAYRLDLPRLVNLLETLPSALLKAEQIVGVDGSTYPLPDSMVPRRHVHLDITTRDERSMVSTVLASMGLHPVPVARTESREARPVSTPPLVALITDAPLTVDWLAAYRDLEVPYLDYTGWRRTQKAELGQFDVMDLHQWIERHLSLQVPIAA